MNASLLPAALMLLSAIIHAGIGVILKKSDDKLAFRAILAVTSALIVLPLAFIVPLPPREAWIFLAIGAFIHFIYQLSQISAFDRGDMSLVYPIMRGVAPALAAGFAFLILDETLAPREFLGLGIAVTALMGFGWPQRVKPEGWGAAMGFALLCGVMISLYSVIDAGGMRLSRGVSGQVWSYMVWFFLVDCLMITPLALYRRRARLKDIIAAELKWGLIAGISSLITFGLALYAFSLAPVAEMSAMRETSVVFGAVFAALLLKEPFGRRRIALAAMLAFGLVLMQTA